MFKNDLFNVTFQYNTHDVVTLGRVWPVVKNQFCGGLDGIGLGTPGPCVGGF